MLKIFYMVIAILLLSLINSIDANLNDISRSLSSIDADLYLIHLDGKISHA
jgi:hypothetical protein